MQMSYFTPHWDSDGELGVEIEMEGSRFPSSGLSGNWTVCNDSSLRGGREFVTSRPIKFPELNEFLRDLSRYLKSTGRFEFRKSDRAAVHLHVNVGHLSPKRFLRFLLVITLSKTVW